VRRALQVHELIKVRLHQHKDERRELAARLAATTGCDLVGSIGGVIVLYREQEDPEKRKVALPRRAKPDREPGSSPREG